MNALLSRKIFDFCVLFARKCVRVAKCNKYQSYAPVSCNCYLAFIVRYWMEMGKNKFACVNEIVICTGEILNLVFYLEVFFLTNFGEYIICKIIANHECLLKCNIFCESVYIRRCFCLLSYVCLFDINKI